MLGFSGACDSCAGESQVDGIATAVTASRIISAFRAAESGAPLPFRWIIWSVVFISLGAIVSAIIFGWHRRKRQSQRVHTSQSWPRLRVLRVADHGKDEISQHMLQPGCFLTLGRAADANIRISSDELISGRHAEVIWTGDELRVRDLGSRNGTRIDGQLCSAGVEYACLGKEVCIGETVLTFDILHGKIEKA